MPGNCSFAGGTETGVVANSSPQGNQGCVINPSKGNPTLRGGAEVSAEDGWEAPAPQPLFYGCLCALSEHMGVSLVACPGALGENL